METYYYVNGKVFKASELDEKRKKMFEDRGFIPLSFDELQIAKGGN